ncbi:hypothetical protein ACIBSW_37800 [Actinoplanes sp. NPDC049668]|uniref:hypothetical protein n=1 Tax=unclassified Actinoplanes TaxID=2626549 RepID=UPI0033A753F6
MAAFTNTAGTSRSGAYVDRRLVGGSAALMTVGFVTYAVGAALGAYAMFGAARRYIAQLEEPPQVTVRRRWGQVRTATGAGVGAWRDYDRALSDSVR